MKQLLWIFVVSIFVCIAPATAQEPQYVALTVSRPPAVSGCSIVHNRDEMRSALIKVGYTSTNLPRVDFTTGGAVVITSTNGSITPDSYLPAPDAVIIILATVSPNAKNYVFVMTIKKSVANSGSCSLLGKATWVKVDQGGRAQTQTGWMKSTAAISATSPTSKVVLHGGSSTTSAMPVGNGVN